MKYSQTLILRKRLHGKGVSHKLLRLLVIVMASYCVSCSQSVADDAVPREGFDIAHYYRRFGVWAIPVTVGGEPNMAILATGSNIAAVQVFEGDDKLSRVYSHEKLPQTPFLLYRNVPYRLSDLPESKLNLMTFQWPEISEHLDIPHIGMAGLPCYSAHALFMDGESGAFDMLKSPVQSASGTKVKMTVQDDEAFLPVTFPVVGTRPFRMETFDTGSLRMTEDRIRALERMGHLITFLESNELGMKDGVTVSRPVKSYVLRWADIGGVRFYNVDVQLGDEDKIGLGLLRQFRMTADFPQETMWLEVIGNPRESHSQPRGCVSRFRLLRDGRMTVSDFGDVLPEARQGLQAQDIIRKMNGVRSEELTFSGLRDTLSSYGSSLALEVERDGQLLPITLKIEAPKNWPPQWAPERTAMLSDFEQFVEQTSSPTVIE